MDVVLPPSPIRIVASLALLVLAGGAAIGLVVFTGGTADDVNATHSQQSAPGLESTSTADVAEPEESRPDVPNQEVLKEEAPEQATALFTGTAPIESATISPEPRPPSVSASSTTSGAPTTRPADQSGSSEAAPPTPVRSTEVATTRQFPANSPAKLTVLAVTRQTDEPLAGMSFVHPGIGDEPSLSGTTDRNGFWQDTLLGGCRTSRFTAPHNYRFAANGQATLDHYWCVAPGGSETIDFGLNSYIDHTWAVRATLTDGSPVVGVEFSLPLDQGEATVITESDGRAEIPETRAACWNAWYAAPAGYLFEQARLVDGYGERLCADGSGFTMVELVLRDVSDGPTGTVEVLAGYRGFFSGEDAPNDPVKGVVVDFPYDPAMGGVTDHTGRFVTEAPVGCYSMTLDSAMATDLSGRADLVFKIDGDQWLVLRICSVAIDTQTSRLVLTPTDQPAG